MRLNLCHKIHYYYNDNQQGSTAQLKCDIELDNQKLR